MYKIVILMGEAGAGKDYMLQQVLTDLKDVPGVHEIVSCTSRPKREGEVHGINYYYYHPNDFETKILNDEMLEFTKFNNWWYGTSYESVRSGNIVNIGVFNPGGVRQLLERPDCQVTVYWIKASDKSRMLRQLHRENNPNVKEIVRRFNTDYEDFKDIDFNYIEIVNEDERDFKDGVKEIVCQIKTMLAQGQN